MAFILILAASALIGRYLLRTFSLGNFLEVWAWATLTGLCCCAVVAMFLGSYSLLYVQLLFAALVLVGLGCFFSAGKKSVPVRPSPMQEDIPLSVFEWICVGATCGALFFALLSALAPITGWDATVAHIALPAAYARAGRIVTEPGNVYSGYPHLLHALYAVAYYPGHELPVTLLNWSLGAMACVVVFSLGRCVGGRRCGCIASALFATAPIFMDQVGSVSIDVGFAALATAALAALLSWSDSRKWGWLALSAFLAGSSCGVRHTGYLIVLLLAIGVLFTASSKRILSVFFFSLTALLAASPWLLRSAIVAHNPLFPFLLSWFPSDVIPHISITEVGGHESVTKTGGMSFWALLRFPYDIIMRPHLYDGWSKSPGGMVLVLGVPGLLYGGARVRRLGVYSVTGGVFFFYFQRFARYLLPFFIPMMVAAAVTEQRIKPLRKWIIAVLVCVFAYGLVLDIASVHFKLPVLLGRETRADYLERRVERYEMFSFANEYLKDGWRVLTVDQRSYFLDMPSFQNHWAMKELAHTPYEAQLQWLQDNELRYILLPVSYIQESGALSESLWPMLNAWRSDRMHFRCLKKMQLVRPANETLEMVEIWEFLPFSDDIEKTVEKG